MARRDMQFMRRHAEKRRPPAAVGTPVAAPTLDTPLSGPSPAAHNIQNIHIHSAQQPAAATATPLRLTQQSVQATSQPGTPSVQTRTEVVRTPFEAVIRRGGAPQARAVTGTGMRAGRLDTGIGQEHGGEEYEELFKQLIEEPAAAPAALPQTENGSAEAAETAPPETEETAAPPAQTAETAEETAPPVSEEFKLPDIEIPMLAQIEKTDAISGAFTYSGSIARGGAQPTGFGVTRSFGSKLTGVTVKADAGTFTVKGTFEHPITYQVRTSTGPDGQVDIASETDSDITKDNYATVASDLTPNMGDLNGRPPRTKFWAEDLTLRHELVHAEDDKKNGPAAMATAVTWLSTQTAANIEEVKTALRGMAGKFSSALLAALSTEDGEKHAYGDGAPSYKARADAIKDKGAKGDYK